MAKAFKKPLKSPIKPKERKPGQTIQGEVDLPFLLLTVLLSSEKLKGVSHDLSSISLVTGLIVP